MLIASLTLINPRACVPPPMRMQICDLKYSMGDKWVPATVDIMIQSYFDKAKLAWVVYDRSSMNNAQEFEKLAVRVQQTWNSHAGHCVTAQTEIALRLHPNTLSNVDIFNVGPCVFASEA